MIYQPQIEQRDWSELTTMVQFSHNIYNSHNATSFKWGSLRLAPITKDTAKYLEI